MDAFEAPEGLDGTDARILRTLQRDGRTTWARLAELIGMSAPSATDRVRRLEERGFIRGFRADLGAEPLGLGTLGFVAVSTRDPDQHEALLENMALVPEIQECHVVAGAFDYLLKIRCRSPEALATLLREQIRSLPGVAATNTFIVLETVKESAELPVPEVRDPPTS